MQLLSPKLWGPWWPMQKHGPRTKGWVEPTQSMEKRSTVFLWIGDSRAQIPKLSQPKQVPAASWRPVLSLHIFLACEHLTCVSCSGVCLAGCQSSACGGRCRSHRWKDVCETLRELAAVLFSYVYFVILRTCLQWFALGLLQVGLPKEGFPHQQPGIGNGPSGPEGKWQGKEKHFPCLASRYRSIQSRAEAISVIIKQVYHIMWLQ